MVQTVLQSPSSAPTMYLATFLHRLLHSPDFFHNLNPLHALCLAMLLSGVPDYFYRNKISSGGDLSHYSSASLY